MSIAVAFHVLSAVIWVGGMFFAVYVLRLAAAEMPPPDRLALWGRVFGKFFPWVWTAIVVLLATGYWMIFARLGGFGALPHYLNMMHGIGIIMVLIFLHLWFSPYRRFRKALADGDMQEAAGALNRIRLMVTVNLWIGLLNTAIGTSGRYLI